MAQVWRKCSSCKNDILCHSEYYVCSVSTCRQKKTNYAFCSVECWDQHIPIERHRSDSVSAIAKRAGASPEQMGESSEPKRRVVVSATSNKIVTSTGAGSTSVDNEVLVVASKVKKYISEKYGMNTSASTMDALSEKIKSLCDQAVHVAREDGRKTVMDRDF